MRFQTSFILVPDPQKAMLWNVYMSVYTNLNLLIPRATQPNFTGGLLAHLVPMPPLLFEGPGVL